MITQIKNKITQIKTSQIIIILLIIGTFFSSSQVAWAFEWDEEPRLRTPTISPYSYLPMETRRPPSRIDRMQRPLPDAAPQAPALITDKYGNKLLYQKGRLRAKLDSDETVTYYAQNQKRFQRDQGRLIRIFEYYGPEVSVMNEFRDILSYERYGLGGKILAGYDSRHNLTNRYEYDKGGYWQINEITKVWKRVELDKPVEERRGGKNGALVAYWKQEGDSLWRIEKTQDVNGSIIDGNRTRYDRFGIEYYETFANDGVRIARYEWENHRLKYEIDQTNHYKKYNRYGVSEEGFLSEAGIEYIEWFHLWEGTRHEKARNLYTNEVRYYDLNENIDRITKIITQEDVERDRAKADDDPYKIGWTDSDVGKEFLLQDCFYFHEVKDLTASQLQVLLSTTRELAEQIYNRIQELKAEGKTEAGFAFVVTYDFTYDSSDGKAMYMLNAHFYDINNLSHFTISGKDSTAPEGYNEPIGYFGRMLIEQAQRALERGDVATVFSSTRRFIELYIDKAKGQQRSLSRLPTENIERYAILNMVGLALSLQGDAYALEGNIEQARAAYNRVINEFSYSQRWDSQARVWKSLKEECQQKLDRL